MVVGVMGSLWRRLHRYEYKLVSANRVCPGIHNDSPSTLNISLLPTTPKYLMTWSLHKDSDCASVSHTAPTTVVCIVHVHQLSSLCMTLHCVKATNLTVAALSTGCWRPGILGGQLVQLHAPIVYI